ncbi:hypothetical protein M3J09_011988 [Ascochyta lentis]
MSAIACFLPRLQMLVISEFDWHSIRQARGKRTFKGILVCESTKIERPSP